MYLDSQSIHLDFDTSTGQIREKLLQIYLESRFEERQILAIWGDQYLQKSDAGYIHLRDHLMN